MADVETDLPGLGELDGVAQEVGEDLSDPQRVALEATMQLGRVIDTEHEPLFLGRDLHQVHDILDQLSEIEGCLVELQLTSFDLGEIEDVVEDAKQGFG